MIAVTAGTEKVIYRFLEDGDSRETVLMSEDDGKRDADELPLPLPVLISPRAR